jgi:citrate synthase
MKRNGKLFPIVDFLPLFFSLFLFFVFQAVLRMLEEIGSVDKIPAFLEDVKNKKRKLMGFGHRIYKNYDPRARIVRQIAYEVRLLLRFPLLFFLLTLINMKVFELVGKESLIDIAVQLEKIALSDSYFIERKLYPNVDFYTGVIYRAMGFPTDMFPVLFSIPRAVGWLAHWIEFLDDPENRIVRPRQIYKGESMRHYVEVNNRKEAPYPTRLYYSSNLATKRREVSKVN